MKLILTFPSLGMYIGQIDEFVESESAARIFDSILEADAHAAYVEHVLGVQCYATLASAKR